MTVCRNNASFCRKPSENLLLQPNFDTILPQPMLVHLRKIPRLNWCRLPVLKGLLLKVILFYCIDSTNNVESLKILWENQLHKYTSRGDQIIKTWVHIVLCYVNQRWYRGMKSVFKYKANVKRKWQKKS